MMIDSKFLRLFFIVIIICSIVIVGAVIVVDPYNVSILRVNLFGFNRFKPKSVEVDRQVKPLEVLIHQPRTIFMGTSRIHQSIVPSELDGTYLAPAYNASVPANMLEQSVYQLQQYIEFDKNLKYIFIEVRGIDFILKQIPTIPTSKSAFIQNTLPLFFSNTAVKDTIATLNYNAHGNTSAFEVKPDGFFSYPDGWHTGWVGFNGFPEGIQDMLDPKRGPMILRTAKVKNVLELVSLANNHGIKIVFLLTPEHAYYEYVFDLIDLWPIMEKGLKDISKDAIVYSFAQPNDWTGDESYWYDCGHFSKQVGQTIMKSLLEESSQGSPNKYMIRLTPENVSRLISERRNAAQEWKKANPEFVKAMNDGGGP